MMASPKMQRQQARPQMPDISWVSRKLWMDHVMWTRLFILSSLNDLPDSADTAARLMKNQKEIGDLIGMFYPNAASQITALLTQHIMIASQLVEAAKNKMDISELRKQWYSNADNLANFLQSINQNLNLRQHFYQHLQLTEGELLNRMSGNYQHEITFFDNAMNQAVEMADVITNALQPRQQAQQPMPQNNVQRNTMRSSSNGSNTMNTNQMNAVANNIVPQRANMSNKKFKRK